MNPSHAVVVLQELSHLLRILAMLAHAQVQTLQTQVEDERVHWRWDGTQVAHQLSHELGGVTHLAEGLHVSQSVVALVRSAETREFLGIRHPVEVTAIHNHAAYLRCGAIHILSGRVGNDVGSPFKRTAVDRGGKGIVHDERHPVLMGDAGKLFNIEYGAARVADGFAKHHLGVRAESLLNLLLAGIRVYEGALDAQLLQGNTEEVEGAAVNLVRGNDVVARLADVEHGVEVGSLSARCQNGAHATFELSDFLSHGVVCRVLESGIEISLLLQVEEHRHLFRVVVFECSTLIDRNFYRLSVLWLIASLHAEGSDT